MNDEDSTVRTKAPCAIALSDDSNSGLGLKEARFGRIAPKIKPGGPEVSKDGLPITASNQRIEGLRAIENLQSVFWR
jgi:hypothetical protein